jgi:hypothetical protein
MDLHTDYLGLRLRTPLVASPSPLTANVAALRKLEDSGVSAVVLPSLFEEEIQLETLEFEDLLERWGTSFGEAPQHYRDLHRERTRPEQYLELVCQAKQSLGIPVFASLNVHAPGPWTDQVKLIEEAGADALELTFFTVAADPRSMPPTSKRATARSSRTCARPCAFPWPSSSLHSSRPSPTRRPSWSMQAQTDSCSSTAATNPIWISKSSRFRRA